MTFWQLAVDLPRLARFWAEVLGYLHAPPDHGDSTWLTHYRRRMGDDVALDDRVMHDPEGNELCVSSPRAAEAARAVGGGW